MMYFTIMIINIMGEMNIINYNDRFLTKLFIQFRCRHTNSYIVVSIQILFCLIVTREVGNEESRCRRSFVVTGTNLGTITLCVEYNRILL